MYTIREITLQHGMKKRIRPVIEFTDADMQIVGEFLMADAPMLQGKVVQEMEAVLDGKKEEIQISGNRTALHVTRARTEVTDLFAGMDDVNSYPSYQMETNALRNLIVMWLEKLNEYDK